MKLHWGPMSPFVRKVTITAHETGLADRITLVRSLVAMNAANADVMRDNPLSKIPTLVTDEGVALFDSDVICEYLDTLHSGPKLIPLEPQPRWQVLRWNAMGSGMLDALVLWRNERMRPVPNQSVETLKTYERKITASLDWVEHEMAEIVARDFSLGHVAIGCMFGYLNVRFTDIDWRAGHPASAAWFVRFTQRPSVQLTDPAVTDAAVPASAQSTAKLAPSR